LVFINSADLVWVVFAAMFWANISIFFLGWLQTKTVVHLLRVPFHFLAPVILLMATVGAYAVRGLTIDIIVMFTAGIAGFFLRRSGYSVPGIVLGLILGKIGEQTFAQAMQMLHYDFTAYLGRPISLILLVSGAATLLGSIYRTIVPGDMSPDKSHHATE
jgi:putative tricarboxylic transport membrane protein